MTERGRKIERGTGERETNNIRSERECVCVRERERDKEWRRERKLGKRDRGKEGKR